MYLCVFVAWITIVKKQHCCIKFLVDIFAAKACVIALNVVLLLLYVLLHFRIESNCYLCRMLAFNVSVPN